MRETPDTYTVLTSMVSCRDLRSLATRRRESNFYATDSQVAYRAGLAGAEEILSTAKDKEANNHQVVTK